MKIKKLLFITIAVIIAFSMSACELFNKIKDISTDDLLDLIDENENGLPDQLDVVLGRGYDITGLYADSQSIKNAVVDLDKLTAAEMIKSDPNMEKGNFKNVSGNTIKKYQSELSTKFSASASGGVKGISTFSGEISLNFDSTHTGSDQYAFATSTSSIWKGAYFVEKRDQPAEQILYLTDAFKADIASLTPEQLVSRYGTHVMLGGVLGARLSYTMSAKKIAGASSYNIGTYAEMRAKSAVGKGSVTAEVDASYSSSFETASVQTHTVVSGGKSEYAQFIQNEGNYDKWIESVDGNAVWCDYYKESLMPISYLIGDYAGEGWEGKKEALSGFIDDYLEGKEFQITSSSETANLYVELSQSGAISINKNNRDEYSNYKGDSEMHTDGSIIKYTVQVITQIINNGTQISVKLRITQRENRGDDTTIFYAKTFTYNLPDGKKATGFAAGYGGDQSKTFTPVGRKGEFALGNGDAPDNDASVAGVHNMNIRVDEEGSNDGDIVTFKASLIIYYTYNPYE